MRKLSISIAAAAFLGSAANGAPILINANAPPSAHVSYADLNLASSEGRARLDGRIRAAAENLCAVTGDRSLDAYLTARSCYEAAVASGVRQKDDAVQQQASASSMAHQGAGE